MQISQKDKTTIIVLLIIMIVAGFYMYGIRPLTTLRTELEDENKILTAQKETAESNYRGITTINLNNKKAQAESLQAQYQALVASGINDANTVIWNGSDEEFKTNYRLFDYMLNDYMVNTLGIVIEEGNVSVTSYTITGVTKTANMTVTSFKCSSISMLEALLNKVASEKSLKINSISWSPDTAYANAYVCNMVLVITVAI